MVFIISTDAQIFEFLLRAKPTAMAEIKGSPNYPTINGTLKLYQTDIGVFSVISVSGLPKIVVNQQKNEIANKSNLCDQPIYAVHIHNGKECSGNAEMPFANAGTHYNPNNCLHPFHSGDMPPLFSTNGVAWTSFYTDRFNTADVIGLTVIIHEKLDDFTTQPSGNPGAMIACGVIRKV